MIWYIVYMWFLLKVLGILYMICWMSVTRTTSLHRVLFLIPIFIFIYDLRSVRVRMIWYDIRVFTEELMKLWKVCVGRLTVGDGALRLCLGHWWPGWCSEDRNTSAWPALMTPAGTVTQPSTRWWLNLEAQIYVDSVHLSMGLNYKYCLKAAITAKSQGAPGNSEVGGEKEEVY